MVDKNKEDDELDIEIVDDGTEIDDSTTGDGIELNDDLFEQDTSTKLEDDDEADPDDEDDPDEDDRQKMGRRAQKRIKQLLAKQKELQDQVTDRDQKLAKASKDKGGDELSEFKRSVTWLENREKELDEFEETIGTSYRSARTNDDVDAEWAAQKALQQVNAERTAIKSRKEQYERVIDSRENSDDAFAQRRNSPKKDDSFEEDAGGQGNAAPQQPDRKAVEWWKANPWFQGDSNEERRMTTAALVINKEMIDEGFDPDTDVEEYYTELDERIAAEFPNVKKGRKMAKKNSPVSGGGRAKPRKSPKGKIKITESMKARADRLGVPIEQYAKEVQKLRDEGKDI